MKIQSLTVFFLLILTPLANLFAQIAIPKGYFSSPLNIGLALTGSFSEVRPNHFHSGIDFSVQKKEGLPVFAVADGFISRIKVSPFGFGNALYIDHPNGFTSVYGHMKGYNDTITEYVRTNQYKLKSFEVDLFPANKKEHIYVKKGQLIGYTGNSGSSGGAHLHFELRNTKTENIINPLLFGFNLPDNYPPYIDFIKIYPEDENSYVGSSNVITRFNVKKSGNGAYSLATKDTISLWGNFSIGTQAFDFNQNQTDRNGFYSMKMFVDSVKFFSLVCDSFSFAESRFVNATIDFSANYNLGSRIIKSQKLPGNHLSFLKSNKDGILSFTDDKVHEICVLVADESNNSINLRFWVKPQKPQGFVQVPSIIEADSAVLFKYNKSNKFETDNLKVEIAPGSLYQDITFTYRKRPGSKGMFSEIHFLHNPEVPIHSKIKVSIKATGLPQNLQSKALLVRIDREGDRSPAGGSYENGYVVTSTNLFDGYAIVVDTIPPVIRPSSENAKSKTSLKFTVSDNFSGINTYKGQVNGQWALVEWDPKNRLMVYKFDNAAIQGKNKFSLFLEDEKGNKTSYSTTFTK